MSHVLFVLYVLCLSVSVIRAPQRAVTPLRKRIWKVGKVHRSSLLFSACLQHRSRCSCQKGNPSPLRTLPVLQSQKSLWLNNLSHQAGCGDTWSFVIWRQGHELMLPDGKEGNYERGHWDGVWWIVLYTLTCMMAQPFWFTAIFLV